LEQVHLFRGLRLDGHGLHDLLAGHDDFHRTAAGAAFDRHGLQLFLNLLELGQLLLRLTHHVAVHYSISSRTLAPMPRAVRTRELCWAVLAVLAVAPTPLAMVRRNS